MSTARRLRTTARGFTLIELLTVVAIIGILSVVAAVSYRKIAQSSKTSEAIQLVSSIAAAQERYRTETDGYLNVSPNLAMNNGTNAGSCYPPGTPTSNQPVMWDPPRTTCGTRCNTGTDWSALNVQYTGLVRFGFTSVAGARGAGTPSTTFKMLGQPVAWGDPTARPWFIVSALGDLDGDGSYSTILVSSWDRRVMMDNEGE